MYSQIPIQKYSIFVLNVKWTAFIEHFPRLTDHSKCFTTLIHAYMVLVAEATMLGATCSSRVISTNIDTQMEQPSGVIWGSAFCPSSLHVRDGTTDLDG